MWGFTKHIHPLRAFSKITQSYKLLRAIESGSNVTFIVPLGHTEEINTTLLTCLPALLLTSHLSPKEYSQPHEGLKILVSFLCLKMMASLTSVCKMIVCIFFPVSLLQQIHFIGRAMFFTTHLKRIIFLLLIPLIYYLFMRFILCLPPKGPRHCTANHYVINIKLFFRAVNSEVVRREAEGLGGTGGRPRFW